MRCLLEELVDLALCDTLLLELFCGSSGVQLEAGLSCPIVLDGLERVTGLALAFGADHDIIERLKVAVGGAENESVVTLVNVGGNQGGSLRVGTGDDQVLDAHNVVLQTDSDETVDVLRDGDEHLAGHVTALLGTRCLVFNVDTGGTLLNEKLGELHNGGQTTVTSVCVGDNGAEVVDVWGLGALSLGHADTGLALLAVVEQLGHEEVLDLVGDGVVGVVYGILKGALACRLAHPRRILHFECSDAATAILTSKIRTGLVGGAGGGRGLPAGNVDGLEVFGHLGDLDWVQSTVGVAGGLVAVMALESLPKLLALLVGGVDLADRATLGNDLLSSVGAGHAGEAWGLFGRNEMYETSAQTPLLRNVLVRNRI